MERQLAILFHFKNPSSLSLTAFVITGSLLGMILVTGAAGFIGYQTARALEKKGIQVISVDELSAFEARPEHSIGSLAARFEIKASPEDAATVEFFEKFKNQGKAIQGIIHLGACSDTTEMRKDYLARVNVEYSKTLWNLAIKYSIPFVYASSAATYGAGEVGYEDEESEMQKLKPLNPYGESKLIFDLWVLEQEKLGTTPIAWSGFKFFNVYGFGELHKNKMASVVLQGFNQIRAHGKLKLFKSHKAGIADGEQKRDFIFVGDVIQALLYALEKPIKRGIYNLGSGKARSFKDLAVATFNALKVPTNIEFIDTPIEIRDRYQYFTEATMNKFNQEGFTTPFTSLENGVTQTVNDLLQHEQEKKAQS